MSVEPFETFVGRTLDGRWKIGSLLGKGGMGYVFEGRQLSVDRPVAIKLVREDAAGEPRLVSRFFREAQVLSQLQHPHVVTLYDFGQDEETGALFMVMELVRGRALADCIEGGERLSLEEMFTLIEQLLGALEVVHEAGVVHRDLKPENILIERTPQGLRATLLDFGVSRIDEPQLTRLTQTGCLQGTPHFMAPEQIEGEPSTARSDLYALGVVLYEALSGVQPFAGETLMSVLMQHLNTTPAPLQLHWALLEPPHEGLIQFVHSLLEKRPELRPASARDALERVRAARTGAPAPAAPATPATPAVEPSPLPAASFAAASPSARSLGETWDGWAAEEEEAPEAAPLWTPARRALVASVAGLGAALVGLLIFLALREPAESTPREASPPAAAPPSSSAPEGASAEVASAAPAPPEVAPEALAPGSVQAPAPERSGGEGTRAPTRRGSKRDLEAVLDQMRQP